MDLKIFVESQNGHDINFFFNCRSNELESSNKASKIWSN